MIRHCEKCDLTFAAGDKLCKHLIRRKLDEIEAHVKQISKLRKRGADKRRLDYEVKKLINRLK